MKKNISVNLQGIIFYIEEDGYEQLSRYLASIRTYFSNYEGHEEIVADIESRIAEIFAARLSPAKQVITLEDVHYLIGRMGNVTDFEIEEPVQEEIPYTQQQATEPAAGPRRLYRDINRKVLGGVCAGLASYLNIDTVWIRLFFILLVVLGIVSSGVSAATGIILYVVLWVAMPQSAALPETTVKRLFRDPEDKKIAGVSSGIAKYFGVDVAVIRILFLVSIFLGGFGLLAYIVLWIAVPEAVTLTERMQMQGDPVTLVGIEQTLKDNLNMHDRNGEESPLAKIILLPVRLISQIVSWLSRALGPVLAVLITLIRIVAGILLLITSVALTVALFTTFFVSLGIIDEAQWVDLDGFPASVFLEGFPRLGLVAGFFVGLIPFLLLTFLAIGLLAKRSFVRPIVGWTMFALWLVSLFIMIATIITFSSNFRRSGEVVTSKTIPVGNYKTLTLDAYDTNQNFENIHMDVQEHGSENFEIIQRVEAKGKTEEQAKQNARMITYRVVQQDSVIRFDDSYEFKQGAAFRDQELSLTLVLPKNKPLRLTREFTYLLPSAVFDRDYSRDKIVRNTWQVKGNMLECLTCATDTLDTDEGNMDSISSDDELDLGAIGASGSMLLADDAYSNNSRSFDIRDFDHITVNGPYHVQITQGKTYSVKIRGEQEDIRRMDVELDGDKLVIDTNRRNFNLFRDSNPVLIQIVAPDIRGISLGGAIKADIKKIRGNDLDLSFAGAIQSIADVNVRNLKLDVAGASISKLSGSAEKLEMDVTGASKIDAGGLRATTVDADVVGASVVEVYASSTLRAEASGASKITYSGNPANTTIDSHGPSKVSRR